MNTETPKNIEKAIFCFSEMDFVIFQQSLIFKLKTITKKYSNTTFLTVFIYIYDTNIHTFIL